MLFRVIRCLRWLFGDLSAAELCIADRTNNVLCLSYHAHGSWFLWLVDVQEMENLNMDFCACSWVFLEEVKSKEVHVIALRGASGY